MKFEIQKLNIFMDMLTIPFPKSQGLELQKLLDKLAKGKSLTVEIKQVSKKRSLNANGMCWAICQQIAEELSKDGVMYTKEDVYREAIKHYGAFVIKEIPDDLLQDWLEMWRNKGLGWIAEPISARMTSTDVICYKGSSEYDTTQMARLIDGLIQDAESVGLSVLSEADKDLLLTNWAKERDG